MIQVGYSCGSMRLSTTTRSPIASCRNEIPRGCTPASRECSTRLSERSKAWIRLVDPSLRPGRNNLKLDGLQLDSALIAHHVHVAASLVDEAGSGGVFLGRARGIVTVIDGRRALFYRHDARARVAVPTTMSP